MTTSIFKYHIDITDRPTALMPEGAEILSAGIQGEELFVWARVRPDLSATTVRQFAIYGTGHTIPDDHGGTFLATVFQGPLVWHVYADFEFMSD